jgi:hypothetical protein
MISIGKADAKMNQRDDKSVMERLLEQELPATGTQYARYRQELSEKLGKIKREEKLMRRVSQIAWGVFGLMLIAGAVVDVNRDLVPDFTRLCLIAATMVSFVIAVALLAFYLLNYRPRVGRGEQEAMLLELHRQLSELRAAEPAAKRNANEH